MTNGVTGLTSNPLAAIRRDGARLVGELERVALLVPGLDGAACGLVPTGLAYVERYRADVLQLEREWDLLAAAAREAWRAGQYAAAAQLVAGVALPAVRRAPAEAEPLLRLGLAASRRLGDSRQYAYVAMHLGCLIFAYGRYHEGRQLWQAGVRLAQEADGAPCPWDPLATFALVADLLDDRAAAQHFAEVALRGAGPFETERAAGAFFLRGLHARRQWDLDRAYEDLGHCVRLLALEAPKAGPLPQRQLFMLAAQAELARVQGDDLRACDYAETAIALAQALADAYTVAVLLIDQARYAYQRGRFLMARSAYLRLREATQQTLKVPIAEHASRFLAHEMADIFPAGAIGEPGRTPVWPAGMIRPAAPREQPSLATGAALSERELAVLCLVAAGRSNQEIAAELVVALSTVKTHLNHIYAKLGARSRTQALARARERQLLPAHTR